MTFMVTSTGRHHYLAGADVCTPENVPTVKEIAHSLAQITRFTGHANRPYSVAEHSILVAEIARERFLATPIVELACLMHDAHECITGDMSSPVKWVVGPKWKQFEQLHENHVRRALGLHSTFVAHHALIRQCDLIALATERRDLLPYVPGQSEPWPLLDTIGMRVESYQDVSLNTARRAHRDWSEWRDEFYGRYLELTRQVAAKLETMRSPAL